MQEVKSGKMQTTHKATAINQVLTDDGWDQNSSVGGGGKWSDSRHRKADRI